MPMALKTTVHQNNIRICAYTAITCIVRKNWAHMPTANGSYGRQ